jgi:putative Holliday junction resolvase
MTERTGRLLGIDTGERRIGVAVSEGRVAVPLTIVDHTNRARDLERIAALAGREGVDTIVIGLPLAPDGGEGEQARLARRFGEQLAALQSRPVVYQDERLTSFDVASAGASRRNKPTDDLAAAAILQRYIDASDRAT